MGFRINTNTAALVAQKNSVSNSADLTNSLARLSSGLRINKAADDASGLAIANSLRSQASSLAQAVSNGNDAIGLIQTADGALNEYSEVLDTIKTKAVQAASDGQNTASRLAIQKDIAGLLENLNTIAKTTSFNGQKLLSGTFSNKSFQMGANANETVDTSIASVETTQIGQTSRATMTVTAAGENQITLKSATTGASITLASVELLYNNDAANGVGAIADNINKYSSETGITAQAIVSSTTGSAIAEGTTGEDFAINGVTIGAINVSANDSESTLLTAINNKTTETGVSATLTEDGKITLTSDDGRAISVTGDIEDVMGSTADEMSTLGYLEVVQAGSATFQITGNELGAAVGEDITLAETMNTIQDSVLAIGSTVAAQSTLAAGTVLGDDVATTIDTFTSISASKDGTLAAGSVLKSGTVLAKGTELTSTIEFAETLLSAGTMLVKAGSTLASGTVFDAGTVLQQDLKVGTTTYKAGTTLTEDVTLDADMILSKDMLINADSGDLDATIGSGSKLVAGTILGSKFTTIGADATLGSAMVIKAGSILESGSTMGAGSVLGDAVLISADMTTTVVSTVKVGSTLLSGSVLKEDSTIGGEVVLDGAVTLNQDMLIKAGSILKTGTILKAGTVLTQDLSAAQVGDANTGLKAGTVLGTDITTTDTIYVSEDFMMLKGSDDGDGYGEIADGSTLAANGGDRNSVQISDAEFTNLSDINVTTLEGAMKAIDTVSAAITNLDTIRSDLGSVQNQITSIINNISVTQVNVKSAESNIRDVDFAVESSDFSKYNILAQSGSYAMSQANSVQQNVLKLLQ